MKCAQVSNDRSRQRGFTRIELLVSVGILFLLVCLFFPQTRGVREAARRATCMNNIRQLTLAQHNYESAHGHFPAAMGKLYGETGLMDRGSERLSGVIALLPFLGDGHLYDQIVNPSQFGGTQFPAGPDPWVTNYPPWQTDLLWLSCPSSDRGESGYGQTNYAFCIGDMAREIHRPKALRGAFGCGLYSTFDDLSDGASNIISMAEIGNASKRFLHSHFATNQPLTILDDPSQCLQVIAESKSAYYDRSITLGSLGRGGCWADGAAGISLFNTILPPNSPSCGVGDGPAVDGIFSAGGAHPGGIIVTMCDGSGHYISNEIDAGDPGQPTLTPEQMSNDRPASHYGIWGALGTASGGEIASVSDL